MTQTFWYLLYLSHSVQFPACVKFFLYKIVMGRRKLQLQPLGTSIVRILFLRTVAASFGRKSWLAYFNFIEDAGVSWWFYRSPIFGKLLFYRHSFKIGVHLPTPKIGTLIFWEGSKYASESWDLSRGTIPFEVSMIGVLRVQCVLLGLKDVDFLKIGWVPSIKSSGSSSLRSFEMRVLLFY